MLGEAKGASEVMPETSVPYRFCSGRARLSHGGRGRCRHRARRLSEMAVFVPHHKAASILVRYKYGRSRKIFLALSRDVGTVRVHRDSVALFRCKSGTGPRPGITSASPSIVVVIVALFTTSCSPCRATTTARASAVRTSSLISQGLGVCQTNRSIIYIPLGAPIAFHACVSSPFSLWSAHSPSPRTASSQTATR